MKSINLDIEAAVHTIQSREGLNKPIGYAKDEHGTFFAIFVATDYDSGEPIWTEDGQRVKLNLRKSNRQG